MLHSIGAAIYLLLIAVAFQFPIKKIKRGALRRRSNHKVRNYDRIATIRQ